MRLAVFRILGYVTLAFVPALLAAAPPVSRAVSPVNLNVAAVDRQGQPVAGLKAEDFQVLDNGKPRKVVWVHAVPQTPAPAVFILLDLLNSDFAARGLSANEISQAVEKLAAGTNVYLYVLTEAEKVYPVHAVGSTRAESPSDELPWTRRVQPLLNDLLRQTNSLKSQDDTYRYLRMEPTWKALGAMAPQIAEAPGPKSFIWITQGVENGYMTTGNQLIRDTSPLRMFARNLSSLQTFAWSVEQRPNGSIPIGGEGSRRDTLDEISALTGGKVIPTDRVDQAIQAAIESARHMNYRIAFEPDRMDGKYHKLRVTAARRDVSIQTADHYYAIADPDALDAQQFETETNAISASPSRFNSIGLAVQTISEPTIGELHISIRVNTPDVELLQQGGRYKGSLAISFVPMQRNGRGEILDAQPEMLDLNESEYAKALKEGIVLTRDLKPGAGVSQIRAVVVDRNSWLAGTAMLSTEAQ